MQSEIRRKKSKWSYYTWNDKVFLIILYTILALITFACIYPLYFTVIASVSSPDAVNTGKVNLLPQGFTLDSYKFVMENENIWRGYANSLFNTAFGTLFSLILTIPTAYALSKKRMLGRNLVTTIFIVSMYFGGGLIPFYMLVNNMHLLNNRLTLIIIAGLNTFYVIVARTYYQNNIPETLCEAARIDGANELYIFFKLVIPLSAPIIAVIALYYAVGQWNSYFAGMIYVTDTKLQPLQVVLRQILIMNQTAFADAVTAGASDEMLALMQERTKMALTMKYSLVFIASAPMLIAYPFIQKHFVKGMMIGSLKG